MVSLLQDFVAASLFDFFKGPKSLPLKEAYKIGGIGTVPVGLVETDMG
jgi:hypothetical protein